MRGVTECDRAIAAGHLVPVPREHVADALAAAPAHPWTVVHQSEDKWRAAQDYSRFTNRRVGSKPFTLPGVTDVTRVVGPDSHFAKYDLRDGFWSVPVAERSRRYLMVRHPATGRLLWCTSLPFGYALSPLHFCAVTEAVADEIRRRVAGRGIHIFVFVDDYLCVGDTEELTAEGMRVMESVFAEFGLPWALHKRRGPARVMEFLGHLLVNTPDVRCVGLTECQQARVSSMIAGWLLRRPAPGANQAQADPLELAQLLGHLVFAAEVIPQGRTFMQALLRQFQGLEVDWMRGTVRYARSGGPGRRISLSHDFWLDLLWLQSALAVANCVPIQSQRPADAAILAGSDASGWGSGGLIWRDGVRHEVALPFTHAERRRPINFRELLGAWRVISVFGEQLRGRTILLELDNSSSVGAGSARRSHAADMQELVRRIVERCSQLGVRLVFSHTPGADLHRPDQISRGADLAEPVTRMRAAEFAALSGRFGPFTELLGAERQHRQPQAPRAATARLWLHPTFGTAASGLRLIGERLHPLPDQTARGLILLPWAPEARWWNLTRHLVCVGRYPIGSRHLEELRLGRWTPVSSRRASALFAFPRAAGAFSLPLRHLVQAGVEGRSRHSGAVADAAISPASPLPVGSLLYVPAREAFEADGVEQAVGCLYATTETFDGSGRPRCVWLRRGPRASRSGAREETFSLERRVATSTGGSFAEGLQPYQPDVSSLWLVSHLGVTGQARGSVASQLRVSFDHEQADREIELARESMSVLSMVDSHPVSLATAAAELRGEAEDDPDSEIQPVSSLAVIRAAARDRARAARREGGGDVSGSDSSMLSPVPAERLQSTTPESRGSASGRTPRRASSPARTVRASVSVRGGPLVRCRYPGMLCAGCDRQLGRSMVCPAGSGMAHNSESCMAAAEDRLRAAEAASRQEEGTPDDGAIANAGAEPTSACEPCLEVAVSARADEPVTGPLQREGTVPRTGSDQRRSQLSAILGDSRRASYRRCLSGCCGETAEVPMRCLGQVDGAPCPAQIHGVACLSLSRGHASLGCFTCPACLLREMRPSEQQPTEADPRWREAETTSMLEMSTGAEATGASWADFIKLETQFTLGVGLAAGLEVMPRDSAASFMVFLSWIVTERDRLMTGLCLSIPSSARRVPSCRRHASTT